MSWKKLIIFAIIAGVYTAVMAILPIAKDTSFADITISFEVWILCGIFIIFNGNTYTVEIENVRGISSIEDINIKIDDINVVKCVDKSLENEILKVKFESVSKGKSYVDITYNEDDIKLFTIYVHNFGIITFNEYMGDSNGSIIIPISIIVFSIYGLYLLIMSYKETKNKIIFLG